MDIKLNKFDVVRLIGHLYEDPDFYVSKHETGYVVASSYIDGSYIYEVEFECGESWWCSLKDGDEYQIELIESTLQIRITNAVIKVLQKTGHVGLVDDVRIAISKEFNAKR